MDTLIPWKTLAADPDASRRWTAYVQSWETKIHSFLSFNGARTAAAATDGPFAGVPFAVKDNIAVSDFPLTCGSKILEPLVASYTATAVEKLEALGARPVAKANLDEFGMGSSCDNSALAKTNNPFDFERVAGGSSGGSAAAVAAGLVPFALGSDTGGSVREPAAFCGVYGLKPTYGAVSRFGLVAYASSLDVVGVLARRPEVVRAVFNAIKGTDPKDQSSIEAPSDTPDRPVKTVGVLKGLTDLAPEVARVYDETIALFKDAGFDVAEVTLPVLDYVVPAYYTIATAEA